jgi:hypothetical protein
LPSIAGNLPPPVARFLAELADDPALGAGVPSLAVVLGALDREGDDNPEALKMMQCLCVIFAEETRPVRERFEAFRMVVNAPKGKVTITISRKAPA